MNPAEDTSTTTPQYGLALEVSSSVINSVHVDEDRMQHFSLEGCCIFMIL